MVTEISFLTDNVTDISPVRALVGLEQLKCNGSNTGNGKLNDLSPVQGMKLKALDCSRTQISNLSPLQGMSLETLTCYRTSISDLSALVGMKLTQLNCGDTLVSDLSPLRGMPIKSLICGSTNVADLSPLRGMPLSILSCYGKSVSDISPLQEMNLTEVSFTPKNITAGLDVIRQMRSIKSIGIDNGKRITFDDFWKKYDAGEFGKPEATTQPHQPWNTPAFQTWVKEVQAIPADEQVKAVSKKLVELNPGFDGNLTDLEGIGPPKIEYKEITELRFLANNVTDISPVRAFRGLKALTCAGSEHSRKGKLSDLSPLRGMLVTRLNICGNGDLSDLSPLRGVPLTSLACSGTGVLDLSPLKEMKLWNLNCGHTSVFDLSPLQGIPTLSKLTANANKVTPASVAALQKALPNCKIEWDDPAKPKAPEPAASDPDRRAAEWYFTKKAEPGTNGFLEISTALQLKPVWSKTDLSMEPFRIIRMGLGKLKDQDLANLVQLSALDHLDLTLSNVSDDGIQTLATLKSLRSLVLRKTPVTPAGIAALQKALPNCKIAWDDPTKPKMPEPAASGSK